jgi:NRPS condensation-like uncharacterized protein
LERVKAKIRWLTNNHMGLSSMGGTWLTLLPYPYIVAEKFLHYIVGKMAAKDNLAPGFTNLGPIDPDRLNFGSAQIRHAEVITPAAIAPTFFMGLSGYKESLTLSIGIHESAISADRAQAFLDNMDRVLPGKSDH